MLAFHIVFRKKPKANMDKITSNLPCELLEDTNKNFRKWLESDNPFFNKNRMYVIHLLGTELLSSIKAQLFFYDDRMLVSNNIPRNKFQNLMSLGNKLSLKRNNYYSWNSFPMDFYILTREFLTSQFYYRNGFSKQVFRTNRNVFEAALSNSEMKDEYLVHHDKHTNIFYMSNNQDIKIHILCEGFSPKMMIIS